MGLVSRALESGALSSDESRLKQERARSGERPFSCGWYLSAGLNVWELEWANPNASAGPEASYIIACQKRPWRAISMVLKHHKASRSFSRKLLEGRCTLNLICLWTSVRPNLVIAVVRTGVRKRTVPFIPDVYYAVGFVTAWTRTCISYTLKISIPCREWVCTLGAFFRITWNNKVVRV